LIATQLLGEGQPRSPRQQPVEQHQVRPDLANHRFSFGNVTGAECAVSGLLEIAGQQIPGYRVVFDYEDRALHIVFILTWLTGSVVA